MIILLLELIFWIIVMRFIGVIGITGTCMFCIVLNLFNAFYTRVSFMGLVEALVSGLITGVVIYIMAKFGLFIINLLGALGSILIGAVFILLLLAILL